jgi:hypothetical protein
MNGEEGRLNENLPTKRKASYGSLLATSTFHIFPLGGVISKTLAQAYNLGSY